MINLHMPKEEATYIHRVGRTARAGHAGRAVTFVEEDRRLVMKKLVKRAVEAKQQIKTRSVNKEVREERETLRVVGGEVCRAVAGYEEGNR